VASRIAEQRGQVLLGELTGYGAAIHRDPVTGGRLPSVPGHRGHGQRASAASTLRGQCRGDGRLLHPRAVERLHAPSSAVAISLPVPAWLIQCTSESACGPSTMRAEPRGRCRATSSA